MSILMTIFGLATFCTYVWMVITAFRKSAGWGIAVLLFSPLAALIFAAVNFEEAKKPIAAFMLCFMVWVFLVVKKTGDFAEDTGFTDMAERIQRGEKISKEDMDRNALRALEKMHERGFIKDADLARARAEFAAKYPPREEPAEEDNLPAIKPATKPSAKTSTAAVTQPEPTGTGERNTDQSMDEVLDAIVTEMDQESATEGNRQTFSEVELSNLDKQVGKLAKITDLQGRQHIGHILQVEPGRRLILNKTSGSVNYSIEILLNNIKKIIVRNREASSQIPS